MHENQAWRLRPADHRMLGRYIFFKFYNYLKRKKKIVNI